MKQAAPLSSSSSNSDDVQEFQDINFEGNRMSFSEAPKVNRSPASLNLINSVANSFTGFLSNWSWADWQKKQTDINNDEGNGASSNTWKGHLSNSYMKSENNSYKYHQFAFKRLYPEEGTSDLTMANENFNSPNMYNSGLDNEKPNSSHAGPTSFQKYSFISSTPLSPNMEKKNRNENLIEETYFNLPSTSGPQKENIKLHSDSYVQKSTSETEGAFMQSDFHKKKRMRDSIESDYQESNTSIGKGNDVGNSLLSNLHVRFDDLAESQRRKRPRFSISTFGSPLYTKEKPEESSSSIFYPGKIMYGGASNHQKKKYKYANKKVCTRSHIKASQDVTNGDGDVGLSSAAKRILNCIDKISTPLSNSKRIFALTKQRDLSSDSSYVADFYKHRPSLKSNSASKSVPPSNKLLTPSKVRLQQSFACLDNARNNYSALCEQPKKGLDKLVYSKKQMINETSPALPSFEQNHDPISFNSKLKKSQISTQKIVEPIMQQNRQPKLLEASKISSIPACNLAVPAKFYNAETSRKERHTNAMSETNLISYKDVETFSFSVPEVLSSTSIFQSGSASDNLKFTFNKPVFENESMVDAAEFDFKTNNLVSMESIPRKTSDEEKNVTKEGNAFDFGNLPFKQSKVLWDCEGCFVQNEETNSVCVCCQGEKPQPKNNSGISESQNYSLPPLGKTTTVQANWAGLYNSPSGWECQDCFLQNEESISNCVACNSLKPHSLTKIDTPSTLIPESKNVSGGWGDSFIPPKGSWECKECLLQNKDSASNCIACQTLKPGNSDENSTNMLPNKVIETENKIFPNNWGDAFKKVNGSWECSNCLLQNTESALKCVACECTKPQSQTIVADQPKDTSGDKSEDKNYSCSWGDSFKLPEGSWECEVCLLQNKKSASSCIACNRINPNNVNRSDQAKLETKTTNTSAPENYEICSECSVHTKNGENKCENCKKFKPDEKELFKGGLFSAKFAKSSDEWECETCLVRNKTSAPKCSSCETPKIELSKSTILSEVVTGNFKFGTTLKPAPKFPTTIDTSLTHMVTAKESLAANNKLTGASFNPSDTQLKKCLPLPEGKSLLAFFSGSEASAATATNTRELTDNSKIGSQPDSNTPNTSTFLTNYSSSDKSKEKLQNFGEGSKVDLKRGFDETNDFSMPFKINQTKQLGNTKLDYNVNSSIPLDKSSTQTTTFAFGQPNIKNLSSGFSFGGASSSESTSKPTFSFGETAPSAPSLFTFGQANSFGSTVGENKLPGTNFGTSLSNAASSNPFSVASPEVSNKRVMRKAFRRK